MIRRRFVSFYSLLAPVVFGALIVAFAGFAEAAGTDGASISNNENKLKSLQTHISNLLNQLSNKKKSYDELQASLKKTEQSISALNKKITQNQAEIKKREEGIAALTLQISQQKATLATLRQHMRDDIRHIHRQGPDNPVKILLSAEDQSTLPRSLYYQQKINEARQRQFEKFQLTLSELESNQATLAQEQQQLSLDQEQLATEKKLLDKKQQQRQNTLADLKQVIDQDSKAILEKKQEAAQLEALIDRLMKARAQVSQPVNLGNSAFAKQQGRLRWPISGKLIHNYNASRSNDGALRWKGVLIAGSKNQPVSAVYDGRVVFAEWMTGFGNLIIIDHGAGFMSLYGYNERLLKTVGASVRQGEAIASVGNSGGNTENALYFEIRQNSKAIDPNIWCKK